MTFPYSFTFLFEIGAGSEVDYYVEIDWDNNGNFTGTYDNIFADTKSVTFFRGKGDELGNADVGQCSIVVNNSTGVYSPSNSGGVLFGLLLPKRPVRIRAHYSFTFYTLFYGFIEEIIPHPHLDEQDCVITALDGLDFISRHDLDTALYKGDATGTIHGYILTDAGWAAGTRTLDTGQDTIPYWFAHGMKARTAQDDIDKSEQGFSYVGKDGYFNFEDRHHRSTATHQTSQGTFSNTMSHITYNLNPRHIYNQVKATVTPWSLQAEAELWRLEETPSIPAGETITWWGESSQSGASVFVDAWVTPVSTTDYTANSESGGGGDDETANISIATTKFAKTIKLAVTNNAGHAVFITLLKARGTWYDDQTKVTKKAEDSTSQAAYQKRTLTIDGKYMTSADTAQNLVDYSIGKYKDPRAELTLTAQNQDAATLLQILNREISDRITVVNTKLGVNADYFIDYLEHEITMGKNSHIATYRIADVSNEDFWCMDYSKLNTQTKLGF